MPEDKNARVECYSGSRYGEHPVAFTCEEKKYSVAAVTRQWRTPEGYCYRVITQEELLFDLMYLENEEVWEVIRIG
jgi:hypothetical protein